MARLAFPGVLDAVNNRCGNQQYKYLREFTTNVTMSMTIHYQSFSPGYIYVLCTEKIFCTLRLERLPKGEGFGNEYQQKKRGL